MNKRFDRVLILVLGSVLTVSISYVPQSATAQGKSEKKQPDKGKEQKKDEKQTKQDAPPARDIMGGKSPGLKSSRQEKDSATMGFNGLDPQGKVEKSMLSASSTNRDLVNAKSLVAYAPVQKELDAFVQEGGLKPAPQQTTSNEKKK